MHTYASTSFGVSVDAHDALSIATFWAEVLGCAVADGADSDNASINVTPEGSSLRMSFHRVGEGKTLKNRMHIDLVSSDYAAEIDRLVALGATTLGEVDRGIQWTTLADPEGNEFDVIKG